jgi:hypothetical protein
VEIHDAWHHSNGENALTDARSKAFSEDEYQASSGKAHKGAKIEVL